MEIDIAMANDMKAYFYIVMGGVLAVVLYGYIYHLYSSERKGENDYEKYANIALDDNIDSTPVQDKSYWTTSVNKKEDDEKDKKKLGSDI
jgi:cytochrome c oxidase cbb3-type subunit 4